MKIKCPENLAGTAGVIGNVLFDESGVSDEISAEQARTFLAIFGGEILTELPGDAPTLDMAVVFERRELEVKVMEEEIERMKYRVDLTEARKAAVKQEVETAPAGDDVYTQETLEALADQGGIKAIREVASRYNVRGKAIGELIAGVLAAQRDAVVTSE